MEFKEFLQQISQQRISVRDKVSVVTSTLQITGTIVPCDKVVTRDGQTLSEIFHNRNEQLSISVKTIPDGMGPDVGTPIQISDVISIIKEN
jgi:hypothetical protein